MKVTVLAGRLIDVAVGGFRDDGEHGVGGGGGDVVVGLVGRVGVGGKWGFREYGDREEYLLGRAMTVVQAGSRQAGSTGELFLEIVEISLNGLTGELPAVAGSAVERDGWLGG